MGMHASMVFEAVKVLSILYLHACRYIHLLPCMQVCLCLLIGASVAKWLAHLPFTSEAVGSSLSENFLNATRTQSSCEKSKSQRSAESRGFPPGTPVSSHRES